jgi:hypothetical protein
MPNNKLILRSVNSPWVSPFNDITTGSVLSWADVDNNFIYLKGEIIHSGYTSGNSLILEKINGSTINLDLEQFGDEGNRWYVPTNKVVEVPSDYQSFIYGDLYLEGLVKLNDNSQLVVLNGDIIMNGGSISGNGTTLLVDLPMFDTKLVNGYFDSGILSLVDNAGNIITVSGISSTDIFITGGTYNQSNGIATFTNNTGGTFNVNGFYTGGTEIFITGGTYNQSNGIATFTNNTGGTFNVNGFYTGGTEIFITGGTYNQSNGIATFTNNTGGTFNVNGFLTGYTNYYTTGATLVGSVAYFDRTDSLSAYTLDLSSIDFTGNTSGNCIGDIWVSNLYGCSPITIHDSIQSSVSTASGDYSFAFGSGTTASGALSHAEGYQTTASGVISHAEGRNTIASGDSSHAEGTGTIAGKYSHAEGSSTTAIGQASHAEGSQTTASGVISHAEGRNTIASGQTAHAEGTGTIAGNYVSHAEGHYTKAMGNNSHAEGANTTASGTVSHAEGGGTIVSGSYSHGEGYYTVASGASSHSEGSNTTAGGSYSHSEGYYTKALGNFGSHAEGFYTTANGNGSHTEGSGTTASGKYSHAEGGNTTASGDYSHAGGINTIASTNTSFIHSTNSRVTGARSAVLGGQNITGSTADTVYVPNLNINTAPANDDSLTQVLVRATDGAVKYRTIPMPTTYGLHAQTGDSVSVSATTVETTILNGGVGTLTVPANTLTPGDSFLASLGGIVSAKPNDDLTIRIKAGSVELTSSGPISMPNIVNRVWQMNITFTVRKIGVATVASIVSLGDFIYSDSSGVQNGFGFNTVNTTTFDTTISNTLNITAEWSSASSDNSIYSDVFVLTKTY